MLITTAQTSKILNYIDSILVIPYFCFFLSVWVYLRHYINIRILLSLLPLPSPFPDHIAAVINNYLTITADRLATILAPAVESAAKVAPQATSTIINAITSIKVIQFTRDSPAQFASIGPYQLNWETQQYKCWISQYITFGLLAALQAVNLFWLFLILRILWRVVTSMGEETRDERSEYDSDEEEEHREELERLRKDQSVPSVMVNGELAAAK